MRIAVRVALTAVAVAIAVGFLLAGDRRNAGYTMIGVALLAFEAFRSWKEGLR